MPKEQTPRELVFSHPYSSNAEKTEATYIIAETIRIIHE